MSWHRHCGTPRRTATLLPNWSKALPRGGTCHTLVQALGLALGPAQGPGAVLCHGVALVQLLEAGGDPVGVVELLHALDDEVVRERSFLDGGDRPLQPRLRGRHDADLGKGIQTSGGTHMRQQVTWGAGGAGGHILLEDAGTFGWQALSVS